MESAVASIAQNIAEGKGRQYKKEFIQFLYVSEGSLFEVLTLLEIFKRRRLVGEKAALEIRKQAEMIDRKLHGLINALRSRSDEGLRAKRSSNKVLLKQGAPSTY